MSIMDEMKKTLIKEVCNMIRDNFSDLESVTVNTATKKYTIDISSSEVS
jgi:hypothetical protein